MCLSCNFDNFWNSSLLHQNEAVDTHYVLTHTKYILPKNHNKLFFLIENHFWLISHGL